MIPPDTTTTDRQIQPVKNVRYRRTFLEKNEKNKNKRQEKRNKAGYTATSCGQVGRGGNARFHSFRLVLTDGPTNQRTDGRTDGRTDKASYRVACPQLKRE